MSAFQLDTSGVVTVTRFDPINCVSYPEAYYWETLDPFTRGYIEALPWASLVQGDEGDGLYWVPCFSDLAPETLARIVQDCSDFQNFTAGLGFKTGAVEGKRFWNGRQTGLPPGPWGTAFPPLTVTLADDGRVVFS